MTPSQWLRWGCYCWDTSLMGEFCFGSLLRPGQDFLIAGSGLSLFLLNLLSFLHSQGPDSVKYLSAYYCPLLFILIPILVFLHLNQFTNLWVIHKCAFIIKSDIKRNGIFILYLFLNEVLHFLTQMEFWIYFKLLVTHHHFSWKFSILVHTDLFHN